MSETNLRETRLEKLRALKELGMDPFSIERFEISHSSKELHENFEAGKKVSYAGRIKSMRFMGKAAFLDISDGDGRFQIYLRKDDLTEIEWQAAQLLDSGDHIGISGELFLTKTGEPSIHVRKLTPLSKAIEPPPIGKEKDGHVFYALADVEHRYRHRHLDLLSNPEVREKLLNRSRIVTATRHYFDSIGYLEVETPLLQTVAGGAFSRPFVAHYNAYRMDVKLRISLELYLKRVLCGDVPRVYEIGRVFRNEGVSNRHNPEFTMLEFYEAYANMEDMMIRTENLFSFVCKEVFGTEKLSFQELDGSNYEIDFSKPWARLDLMAEIESKSGIKPEELSELESAKRAMERAGLPSENEDNLGGIIEKLLEKFVEPGLQEPTFVSGYPIETSPLAKKDPKRPGIVRRFEGYVRGRELCNAFSELNDPIDQKERFDAQMLEREKGDAEAHPMDSEFLYAIESGMPPAGGVGIGIDRMTMLLTGSDHIREVILFPMMKPQGHETTEMP